MSLKSVNICLHDVVASASEVKTIYDTTRQQVEDIVKSLQRLRAEEVIDSYQIFFDDGYKSSLNVATDVKFGIDNENIHLAIITDDIGKPNKLTKEEIVLLSEKGFAIDSHGVSHAALAIFKDDVLQSSPEGGVYRNMPYGKQSILSTQEMNYQLTESSKHLASITGSPIVSFVLPYGLYNHEVIHQAVQNGYYRIYTCDAALDDGQFLASRLLVTQENIERFEVIVRSLPTQPKLLI